eukprot:GEZU01014945.1.p1 GENE.GEZU01014945.1~~GEZU01014945.1.p1  ORF type:complete len:579 (+),score=253.95 GEZU01014945.1:136-1872(+)
MGAKTKKGAATNNNNNKVKVVTSSSTEKKDDVAYSANGVLTSHPLSRDIKIESFCVSLHGTELLTDTTLELNFGRRYGLVGQNGTGKSVMLHAIASGELPIPKSMDIFLLEREAEATDLTALEAVIQHVKKEVERLEAEAERLSELDPESDMLMYIYECIDELDIENANARAAKILHGLGFTKEMQQKKTKDFSGGWRMRIALAQALFVKPTILLLDEPTNHLDLESCLYLEEYLKNYNRILVIVSHSQDFLNNVTTNIINIHNKKLVYYGGNYDTYVKTRAELEEHQMKMYNWEQNEIKKMKEYINRFGHGSAKLARQAQSKEKTMAKMIEAGLTEKVVKDRVFTFTFPDCGKLPPPVLSFNDVAFGYQPDKLLYKNLTFGVDLDSRIALVGPNGAGKSTLLKLMAGKLEPTDGLVRAHPNLRIGWYHQHLTELLDLDTTPLKYMRDQYPDIEEERMRALIGKYGVSGKVQTMTMRYLSDGMKSRVVFAWIAIKNPHLLLLDEPTNHLDIECIDALADAINEFEGGMVLVSHDFRLINQVAKEIWVCEHGTVKPWNGDIMAYKEHLRKRVAEEQENS